MKFSLFSLILLLACSDYAIAQVGIPANDPYAARKVFYEQHWQRKIESALRFVDGAVVNVNVELTPEIAKSIKSLEINGEPIAENEDSKVSQSNSNGSPGRFIQGPGRNNDRSENSEVKEESHVSNRIPTTESTAKVAGLVPRRVSVCVTIRGSYYEKLREFRRDRSKENNQASRAREIAEIKAEVGDKVKETIAALLPKEPAVNNFGEVVVTSFEDLTDLSPVQTEQQHATRAFHKGDVITLTLFRDQLETPRNRGSSHPDKKSELQAQRIAVEIVDVKANGCLVIEGHQNRINGEHRQKLDVRGVIHASSIGPDATVPSSEVADLKLAIFESNE